MEQARVRFYKRNSAAFHERMEGAQIFQQHGTHETSMYIYIYICKESRQALTHER